MLLGNLNINTIENWLGIEFTEEDREFLKNKHQARPSDLGKMKWHCFSAPFVFMTDTKESADVYLNLFQKYQPSKFLERFEIGWEK